MPEKTRETLKNHFKAGSKPSQKDFEDLIDSVLNVVDDGIRKSEEKGLEISQIGTEGKLISFSESGQKDTLWFIKVDAESRTLFVGSGTRQDVLSIVRDAEAADGPEPAPGKVGINMSRPEHALDVAGVVRSKGRIGIPGRSSEDEDLPVAADGQWHDITKPLTGCYAFEVIAGVGLQRRKGRYALMHAFAVNTFNPVGFFFNFLNLKKRIRYHQAYYRSRSDKLKLRWYGKEQEYTLQLRTQDDYGVDSEGRRHCVKYYITDLWFDENMEETLCNEAGDGST